MKINEPYKRLSSLWGVIDYQHNKLIATKISGSKILDVGCGYGSLTDFLKNEGWDAEGIDNDLESHNVARKLFPNATLKLMDAKEIGDYYGNGTFDTIVLKDCLHHLVCEGASRLYFLNFRSILKSNGRLVVLDPNPIWILRFGRKLILHKDPKMPLDYVINLLEQEGFKIRGVDFYEVIGLALSGGYVGIRFIPNFEPLNRLVALTNHRASIGINRLGLGPFLCWRYLVYADKILE
jgi:2-polyprenyl-3-methyl-5-hydroxy-6-metoxy-1,4-benzoquinol methylase